MVQKVTVLSSFHPLVRGWFLSKFGSATEPQELGWPAIAARKDTLIAAPTGSGKTLAAFLSCIDDMVKQSLAGVLPPETQVVYVSPLKALSNDIKKNLDAPLAELRERAIAEGLPPLDIRVAVRTGDTTASARAAMVRKPPHLFVTTPESLYILLTSESGRNMLRTVKTVIVDEIHAVAADKRGSHLALSLERLERLCDVRPVRIGLSATQNPIEEVARFLVGKSHVADDLSPDCAIVDACRKRELDLAIELPREELAAIPSKEQWGEMVDRIAELVKEHRSTLVFVSSRRVCERVTRWLGERLGGDAVAAHHGSLSRAVRLRAEERLKGGETRVVIATASLELGIDVGTVDLVCQVGSPRSFAVALQRVGRSGHFRGAVPKARFFPTTPDELIETAATLRGVKAGLLERLEIVAAPIDILCQQIVAIAACEEIGEDALFALVRRTWSYHTLERHKFDDVITMLSEGISTRRGRRAAFLHRDAVARTVKGRRGARLAALTGAGAIPDAAVYRVLVEPDGANVGTVDEEFAIEGLASGDVFLLGNSSWRVRKVEPGIVRVEDAKGAPASVPVWFGEGPSRSGEVSREVGLLREEIVRRAETDGVESAVTWLATEVGVARSGARQGVLHLVTSKAVLGEIPSQDCLVAERFFDDSGGMQLVLHAPFGARINRGLGLALRKRFCRTFDFELQAAATDDGVLLSLGPQHSFPLTSIFGLLAPDDIDEVLTKAALQSPMFGVRWRWALTRALAIPRLMGGKRLPPVIARIRADDLLAAVFPAATACQDNDDVAGPREIPDHPLVDEVFRDCLHDAMDLEGLRALLGRITSGSIRMTARDVVEPSPLSHEIIHTKPYTYLDDAPLEERRARAVTLRRGLTTAEAARFATLDPAAITTVREQVWPDIRTPDELHDVLLDLCILPERDGAAWASSLEALMEKGRVGRGEISGRTLWVAAERAALVSKVVEGLRWIQRPAEIDPSLSARVEDAFEGATRIVRGWASVLGPFVARDLIERLGLESLFVNGALARLEMEGTLVRGQFTPEVTEEEWCDREVLARMHRLTLFGLRRQIEPTTVADFMRFLLRWQHVQPGTQVQGMRGVAEVVAQLEGYHVAAGSWEDDILASRVEKYRPEWLDSLCFDGEVAWGRLVFERGNDEEPRRRAAPTRNAPVALLRRAQLAPLLDAYATLPPPLGPSAQAVVTLLGARGAVFTGEIAQGLHRVESEVEATLWELVSAGLVTCDGFSGLRALVSAHRAARSRPARRGGRWSLLRTLATTPPAPRADEEEGHALLAEMYLRRYGVVFRDILAREPACPPWRDLVRVYRGWEAQGRIRGGRFVGGPSGEQFAKNESVEALRSVRRIPREGKEVVEVSATDPLNLAGILTPGPRIAAVRAMRVRFVDGIPTAAPGGRRLAPVASLPWRR